MLFRGELTTTEKLLIFIIKNKPTRDVLLGWYLQEYPDRNQKKYCRSMESLYRTLKQHGYTLTGHASNRGDRVVDLMPITRGLYVDDQFRVRYSPTGELVFKNKYRKPSQKEGILLRILLFPTDIFFKHKKSYLESYPENTDNTFGVQLVYIRKQLRELGIELINEGEMLKPRIEDKNMELSRQQKSWRKINFEIISEKYIVTTKEQQDTVYDLLTQCLINNELISGYMLMTNGICSKPIE